MSASSLQPARRLKPSQANRARRKRGAPMLGRPMGDHAARRDDLLDAAHRVVDKEGFNGLSIRKVAAAADCSTGTVTYYFKNKEDIVLALAEQIFDSVSNWPVQAKVSPHVDRTLQDMLESILAADAAWVIWFQLLAQAQFDARLKRIMNKRYLEIRTTLTEAIAVGQKQGSIRRDVAAEALSDHFTATIDGCLMMTPVEPGRYTGKRGQAVIALAMEALRG